MIQISILLAIEIDAGLPRTELEWTSHYVSTGHSILFRIARLDDCLIVSGLKLDTKVKSE